MPLEIPVSQSAYSSITVDLDQETFRIDLRWNSREEAWYMDVRQVDDTPIRIGVKVTPQAPINLPYRTGGMPRGVLQVLPERSTIRRVGRYDFGTNAKLYYISPDEFAEITAALTATEEAIAGPVTAPEAPVLTALYVDASGTSLVAVFSELLASVSGSIAAGFTLEIDAVGVTPASATIFGNVIQFGIPTTDSTEVVTLAYDATAGDIWSTDLVYLASFAAVTASNVSQAAPATPTLVTGSVATNGRSISLSFSDTITAGTPPTGFTYTLNAGAPITPTGGSLSGGGVVLDTGIILSTDVVAVQYSDVAGDIAGVAGDVATFTSAITNNSTLVVPALASAVVNTDGSTVTLTFNQTLTGSATTGLSLTADAVNVPLLAGVLSGNQITLTVEAIFNGATVLVSYDDTTGDLVGAGGDLPSFTNSAVTNNSTRVPPTIVSASIAANGTTVNLTFTENLNGAGNATAGFTYYVNGSPVTPSGGSISTNTITHTIALVYDDDVVTLDYDDVAGNIEASVGGADMVSFSGVSVVNGSTQQSFRIDSAAVNAAGTTLTITMTEAIKNTSNATNGWTLKVNGGTVTITSGSVIGSTLVWTVPQVYDDIDVVTISYNPASGNVLADSDDTELAAYTDYAVTNNSTEGWTPADITGILDYGVYSDTSRLKQNTAGTTAVTAVGQAVRWWRGQLDVVTLTSTTIRSFQLEADCLGATTVGETSDLQLQASYSRAYTLPFSVSIHTKLLSTADNPNPFIAGHDKAWLYPGATATNYSAMLRNGTRANLVASVTDIWQTQTLTWDGASGTVYVDGASYTPNVGTNTGSASVLRITGALTSGAETNANSNKIKGWAFFTTAISSTDETRLRTYWNAI